MRKCQVQGFLHIIYIKNMLFQVWVSSCVGCGDESNLTVVAVPWASRFILLRHDLSHLE